MRGTASRVATSLAAGIAGASLVLATFAGPTPHPVTQQLLAADGANAVHFTASGDIAARAQSGAVLDQVGSIQPDLHLALGDLSYDTTGSEQAWCDFVTSRVGAGFPFQLVSGNHESNGLNGNINDFSACLPNQLPGLVGTYGRQYYVDVPQVNPLVRFIMISPALTYPNGLWSYPAGGARYQWTASAIDGARSAGIPWVVAGMHKPCLSVGTYTCEPGSDLLNLLVTKRVDLVLSGHEHLYARSKQLALSASCAAIAPGTYAPGCISDADDALAKGAGTVMAIVGTGGVALRDVNPGDSEAGYFAASSGLNQNPSHGNLDVRVTADTLTAGFVPTAGGTFTDSFTIAAGAAPVNQSPLASFSADCVGLACSLDGTASADPDGTIAGYSWSFGDGGTGSGPMPSHSYLAAGSYSVGLTVTDNAGATGESTRVIEVTAPPAAGILASDAFGRTVTNGLGTADTGGPWSTTGSATLYSVDGAGNIRLAAPGSAAGGYLGQVASSATDLGLVVSATEAPTGTGTYVWVSGRRVAGAGGYEAKIALRSSGAVGLSLVRVNATGGGEVTLQPAITLPGLSFAAGDRLNVRLQVTGVSPTTLRAKVWKVGSVEPTTWQRSVTDATAALQATGGVGVRLYLSGSATNAPVHGTIDDLVARLP